MLLWLRKRVKGEKWRKDERKWRELANAVNCSHCQCVYLSVQGIGASGTAALKMKAMLKWMALVKRCLLLKIVIENSFSNINLVVGTGTSFSQLPFLSLSFFLLSLFTFIHFLFSPSLRGFSEPCSMVAAKSLECLSLPLVFFFCTTTSNSNIIIIIIVVVVVVVGNSNGSGPAVVFYTVTKKE